jgi:hypothetical protein
MLSPVPVRPLDPGGHDEEAINRVFAELVNAGIMIPASGFLFYFL